ncbi:MAG: hypothetical protein N2513_07850 [Deltaproteobacteria bacterium]|nr:hypothetical protein [Deltaproteobacteria bacterium]
MKYLYNGLGEHRKLVSYISTAISLNASAFVSFMALRHFPKKSLINIGCILIIIGVYIEKGLCFIIPGFGPDPIGEIYEYGPSFHEMVISVGILATGLLIYTLLTKPAVGITLGKLRNQKSYPVQNA